MDTSSGNEGVAVLPSVSSGSSHAIEIDADDILYVADCENMRIDRHDSDGNFLGEWLFDAMVCTWHLHSHGFLYITTGFDSQLARVDMNGRVLGLSGVRGVAMGSLVRPTH